MIPWVFLQISLFFSQINIAAETAIGSSDYLLLYAASVRQRYGVGSMGRVPDVLVSPQKRWKRQEVIWVCLKIGYIPNDSHLIGIMIINHWV